MSMPQACKASVALCGSACVPSSLAAESTGIRRLCIWAPGGRLERLTLQSVCMPPRGHSRVVPWDLLALAERRTNIEGRARTPTPPSDSLRGSPPRSEGRPSRASALSCLVVGSLWCHCVQVGGWVGGWVGTTGGCFSLRCFYAPLGLGAWVRAVPWRISSSWVGLCGGLRDPAARPARGAHGGAGPYVLYTGQKAIRPFVVVSPHERHNHQQNCAWRGGQVFLLRRCLAAQASEIIAFPARSSGGARTLPFVRSMMRHS
jgi:hypothetical protein